MIKLSKKGYYAIKTIIFLASENNSFLKIAEISEKLEISESLLRRIISELEKSGIVKTIKGRNGGISIGKKFSEISIYDILLATGEELGLVECTMGNSCDKSDGCEQKDIYNMLQKGFNGVLKLYTLDKILRKSSS